MRKRFPLLMSPAKPMISGLILALGSLPALAQNAAPGAEASVPKAPGPQAPRADISRTQPVAPIPADAPRFASSGLEIKISSFGVKKSNQGQEVSISIAVILINNNDYDVGVLNVEEFSLIDNAGNSLVSAMVNRQIHGIATCSSDVSVCHNRDVPLFVPYDRYTVISSRSAIPTTFYVKSFLRGDLGDRFTFTTKLLIYKVPVEQESSRKSKIETRLITVGIPNIIVTPDD